MALFTFSITKKRSEFENNKLDQVRFTCSCGAKYAGLNVKEDDVDSAIDEHLTIHESNDDDTFFSEEQSKQELPELSLWWEKNRSDDYPCQCNCPAHEE